MCVLYGQNRIFPHKHLSFEAMKCLPCFDQALDCLRDVGLLPFVTDHEDWNEELILQFYATLHISGFGRHLNTCKMDFMIRDEHISASALDFFPATPLGASGEDLDPRSEANVAATRSIF